MTVVPADGDPRALAAALVSAGLTPRVSDLDDFAERTAVLPFLHEPTGLGLDVVLVASGLESDCIDRAFAVDIGDGPVPVIRAEDLIVLKVLSGRPKDVEDVRSILRRRRDRLGLPTSARSLQTWKRRSGRATSYPSSKGTLLRRIWSRGVRGRTDPPRWQQTFNRERQSVLTALTVFRSLRIPEGRR